MEKLKQWFRDVLEPSPNTKMNQIAEGIRKIAYATTEDQRTAVGFECNKKYSWYIFFGVGEYDVKFTHQIRGDLIQIRLGDEEVLAYVDQTHAYSEFIGWGDVSSKEEHFEIIYQEVSKL